MTNHTLVEQENSTFLAAAANFVTYTQPISDFEVYRAVIRRARKDLYYFLYLARDILTDCSLGNRKWSSKQ